MVQICEADNTESVDQSGFWDSDGIDWDKHRIGWAIAGGCAALTVLISTISVLRHCLNYRNRAEQRQIIRILYMPPVYAIISFFSYRFFRKYTYYALVEVAYESVTLSAFLLLLIEYVAATAMGHDAGMALMRKDKKPLPFPFGYWHYRPSKPYFMYTLKWSVMQYVIIRPLISIVSIVCEVYGVLGYACGYSIHFAEVYLEAIDFISISFALYGLIVFYGLTKEELTGRRPLAKFLSIKLIVMFTFYQGFVFSALESHGKIKATQYWTSTNIADGLNALCICIEMVFFSAFMMWAFSAAEYNIQGGKTTWNIFRPIWDSINLWDFVVEIFGSFKFFAAYARNKPGARSSHATGSGITKADGSRKLNYAEAFGMEGTQRGPAAERRDMEMAQNGNGNGHRHGPGTDEENVRLEPYPMSPTRPSNDGTTSSGPTDVTDRYGRLR